MIYWWLLEHVGGSVPHSKVVYLADANLNRTTTEDGCEGKRSDVARGGGESAEVMDRNRERQTVAGIS